MVALNATLGMMRWSYVNEGWRLWRLCSPGDQRREGDDSFRWLWLLSILWVQQVEHYEMASPSLARGEQRRGKCHCSRCVGKSLSDEKGKAIEDGQSRDNGEGTLAENCFHVENTTTDRRILASLERELQVAFRFEDGNGRLVN